MAAQLPALPLLPFSCRVRNGARAAVAGLLALLLAAPPAAAVALQPTLASAQGAVVVGPNGGAPPPSALRIGHNYSQRADVAVGWPLVPSADLWQAAVAEEGLKPNHISTFGRNIPKFPRSMVQQISKLSNQKLRKYNFQGTMSCRRRFTSPKKHRRQWALDFAREHFEGQDFMNVMDADESEYKPVGGIDRSLENKATERLLNDTMGFWQVLSSSNFTLCPGGDEVWSMRAYEAALARSLPVIASKKEDWNPIMKTDSLGHALQAVFDTYHYVDVKDLRNITDEQQSTFRQENFDNFIKYQTFMRGDNVPPGYVEWFNRGQTKVGRKDAYPCGFICTKWGPQAECCKDMPVKPPLKPPAKPVPT